MQCTNKRRVNPGNLLIRAGRSLTRSGRLAGMIQVCRPNWSGECAWHVAQYLMQNGMQEYRNAGSLSDYLAQLERRLTEYSRQHFGNQHPQVASEMELQRWASKWRRYRNMARANAPHTARAA